MAAGLKSEFPPLRSIGTLPSDTSILDTAEFHPVSSFSGRDDDLAAVHAAMERDDSIAVIHGLGGVGKSSIAREYGWRNRDRHSVVWWLNAQTEDGIIDGLLRLGAMFASGLEQLSDRRVAAQRVVNSILGGLDKPALLVFDNLEDELLLRTWLPRTGARALATSRDAAWSADVIAVPLEPWDLGDAAEYLQRASGRDDLTESDARAIAQALGALPLALAHAAGALRSQRMVSPQRYLERLAVHLKNAPRGADYPRSVFATFATAIAQAEQQSPGAAALLCFAACFAPDAIPDELFRQDAERYADGLQLVIPEGLAVDLRSVISDPLRIDEALGALDRLSLFAFAQESRTYRVHRLVQLAALDLAGERIGDWRACAVDVISGAFPTQIRFENWPRCQRLLAHVRAALAAMSDDSDSLAVANIAHACGMYLHRRGDFAGAEKLYTRCLAIRERMLGPVHFDIARTLYQLGVVNNDLARYERAEAFMTRSLAIREELFGPDDARLAIAICELGTVQQARGRYKEAEQMYRRALALEEQGYRPDDTRISITLNNLGDTCVLLQRFDEADRLYDRARSIVEQYNGPDHPDIALFLCNKAESALHQGRFEDAKRLLERAMEIWEKAVGPDHPHFAIALNNMGGVYRHEGRFDEAEQMHERALAIHEQAVGPNHPWVATDLHDLGMLYVEQGSRDKAALILTRALEIRRRLFGPEHPFTLATIEALEALAG